MCIQLACSWIPRAFEEAHRRNIQAKFYNEKFPLVWKDNLWDSLHEEQGATLKHKCGKRDSSIALFLGLSFFIYFCLSLFFLFGQCSNNDDHRTSIDYNISITTRNLEQDMTLYECLRWCTGMMQWSSVAMTSKKWTSHENIMLAILWPCKTIWQ